MYVQVPTSIYNAILASQRNACFPTCNGSSIIETHILQNALVLFTPVFLMCSFFKMIS